MRVFVFGSDLEDQGQALEQGDFQVISGMGIAIEDVHQVVQETRLRDQRLSLLQVIESNKRTKKPKPKHKQNSVSKSTK